MKVVTASTIRPGYKLSAIWPVYKPFSLVFKRDYLDVFIKSRPTGLQTDNRFATYTNVEGKSWEIWSHTVMLGKEMVDTRGAVPSEVA